MLSVVYAADSDERRSKIINIIDQELVEVSKLSSQRNNRDADLLLRMAELNLEKARLIRESENEAYLKIPDKKRSQVNKKEYFKKSSSFFKRANQLCLKITRSFPKYSKMGDVYYILGFNAKEANKEKTAAKFLSRATKKAGDKLTRVKSQISLAEIYYNQKKYTQAIPLYESALSTHKDKWWTKDSFNLAWCYFRANRNSKAINKMEEVYTKSKDSKFIDMRDQVERDIGLFYATGNRINEGIKFYKNLGIEFTDQLIKISLALFSQGKLEMAKTVLTQAEKYEKDEKKLIKIYIEKLVLYEKFGKYRLHLDTAKKLTIAYKKRLLNKLQETSLIFQMEKVSAILQRQVVSKTYKRLKKQRKQKAYLAIEYFELLSQVNKTKKEEYKFLKAETAIATGLYLSAYKYYKESFEVGRSQKKPRFLKKSIDGLLISMQKLKNSETRNIYVFENFLKYFPNDKNAKEIYTRLFNNYVALGKYDQAVDVLNRYAEKYPKSNTQEAMIAKLMEMDRKAKRDNNVRNWITQIGSGKYLVSGKFKNKLQELLTSMQIAQVQNDLSTGKKKEALKGYFTILDDPYATKKSKVNAKYNLAALFFELGRTEESYKWSIAAMDEMGPKDVLRFSSSFISISNFLFNSFEFKKSEDLSFKYLDKVCSLKSRFKNTVFKNGAFISLANGDTEKTEKFLALGQKCRIKSKLIEEVEYELTREYFSKKNWVKYEFYAEKVKDSRYFYNRVIDDYLNLVIIHRKYDNQRKLKELKRTISSLYYKSRKNNKILSLRVLDFFAEVQLLEMNKILAKKDLVKFSSIEKFKKDFDLKFKYLQMLEEEAKKVLEIGSGKGIVSAYKILDESFTRFAKNLETVEPTGLKKEFIPNFRKDLDVPVKAAYTAAKTYRDEAKKVISENEILNDENVFFQKNPFKVKFFNDGMGILMDRGGF